MKLSSSGLYLLLAVLLILASIPVATRNLGATSIPVAIGRVVLGAFLFLCGGFLVATFVRSRLIIDGALLRFRIVFREELYPLSEIEGFRTLATGPASHRASRRVICVKGRNEPIELAPFGADDFLQSWLSQFRDLDQPDQTGSPTTNLGTDGTGPKF